MSSARPRPRWSCSRSPPSACGTARSRRCRSSPPPAADVAADATADTAADITADAASDAAKCQAPTAQDQDKKARAVYARIDTIRRCPLATTNSCMKSPLRMLFFCTISCPSSLTSRLPNTLACDRLHYYGCSMCSRRRSVSHVRTPRTLRLRWLLPRNFACALALAAVSALLLSLLCAPFLRCLLNMNTSSQAL
jgi:hypothetical protein